MRGKVYVWSDECAVERRTALVFPVHCGPCARRVGRRWSGGCVCLLWQKCLWNHRVEGGRDEVEVRWRGWEPTDLWMEVRMRQRAQGDEWICAGVRRVDRLSDHAVEKMKETMDVVQGRRLVIAEATYQHLFTADPAARHLFSLEFRSESNMQDRTARAHGNDSADDARKKSGAGEKPQMHLHGQAQVVAQMLFRFLGSLDNIRDFERHVSVIVAKHAARNIQPEQFFEWGNGFLSAIRAQLGELATPDVMDAWTEAYAYLATLMITKQQEMVEERASQRGGWKGFRPFIVKRLEAVASHGENKAVKLTLVPEDGQPTLVQKPGQYVCVRVSIPVEAGESPAVMHRNYQCAGIPTQGQYEVEVTESYSYRSQSSSNEILLRSLHEGSRLDLSVPLGGFLVGK